MYLVIKKKNDSKIYIIDHHNHVKIKNDTKHVFHLIQLMMCLFFLSLNHICHKSIAAFHIGKTYAYKFLLCSPIKKIFDWKFEIIFEYLWHHWNFSFRIANLFGEYNTEIWNLSGIRMKYAWLSEQESLI